MKTVNAEPEYYSYMYLDGYSPQEILNAYHRSMKKALLEKDEDYEFVQSIVNSLKERIKKL